MISTSSIDVQDDVVPLREAHDDELPASARRLVHTASENGWTVQTRYASGYQRHKDGTPVTSLAVRLFAPGRHLVAVWTDGRADGAWQVQPRIEDANVWPTKIAARDVAAQAKERVT